MWMGGADKGGRDTEESDSHKAYFSVIEQESTSISSPMEATTHTTLLHQLTPEILYSLSSQNIYPQPSKLSILPQSGDTTRNTTLDDPRDKKYGYIRIIAQNVRVTLHKYNKPQEHYVPSIQ